MKIEFINAAISYKNKKVLENFNFCIPENKNIAIIGTSSSGKTTILKSLANKVDFTNLFIAEKETIRIDSNQIAVVLNELTFNEKNAFDELAVIVKKYEKDKKKINEIVNKMAMLFDFSENFKTKPNNLSINLQVLLKIMISLISNPKIMAIDNLLVYLTDINKGKLINYLQENNINLILVTNNIEETIFTDYIYIMDDCRVIAEGNTFDIFKEEKLLNRLSYGLPFLIDLSTQLKYYNLVDKVYIDRNELVGDLWK